jgi:2-methylcitrate dehydratase PrpD
VAHPAIDGILRLRREGVSAKTVKAIVLKVHPRVVELTGNPTPKVGLEGKFSVQHSVAVALVDGRAGPGQYTDARVKAEEVVALRERVKVVVDQQLRIEEAHVAVTLDKGDPRSVHVPHAIGSRDYPLTDEQLDDKVRDLLQQRRDIKASELRQQVYALDRVTDMRALCQRFLGGE